jgi:hypothetical protein
MNLLSAATRARPLPRSALCAASLVLALGAGGARAEAIVLGDSIGAGIAAAAGLPKLARPSVSLRGDDVFDQLRRAPRGATAYLALGTNDAFDPARSIPPKIDRILAAAARSDLRLVWIGPPCVRKAWNHRAQALDALLRADLAGRAAYVGIAEPRFCDAKIKAPDGVHFTMRGYRLIWEKARMDGPREASAGGSVALRTTLRGAEGAAHD